MVTVIPGTREFNTIQYLTFLTLLIILVVGIYYAWNALVVPYSKGLLGKRENVYCENAPPKPINLRSRVNDNRAYLAWNPTSFTDSYEIYLSDEADFQPRNALRTLTSFEPRTLILNLAPGGYYVKVAAVNSCGTSLPSTENSFEVVKFPELFRLCKKDTPSLCMSFVKATNDVFLLNVEGLANPQDYYTEFTLVNGQIQSEDGAFCLNDNFDPLGVVEAPVSTETCPLNSNNWTIDISTGEVFSENLLLLGADSSNGSQVYNTTDVAILFPNDARYLWEVQPRTF